MKRIKQWLACRRLERMRRANLAKQSSHSKAAHLGWKRRKGIA